MLALVGGILLVILLAAPATPGATPVPTSAIPPLIWELIELPGADGEAIDVAEPERYTLQFLPNGDMVIGADCNRATGTYTVSDSALDVTLGLATLALCPPDSQADPFLAQLEDTTRFEMDDDGHLVLAGPDGSMRLRPSLLGVRWEWQDFRGGDDSVVIPEDPERYTITFLPDGKLAIRADCNRAIGAFAVDGAALDLEIGGVTRALCPEGSLMDDFLRDVDAASSHVFRDGRLYLALPVDAGIMSFTAHYVAPPEGTPAAG